LPNGSGFGLIIAKEYSKYVQKSYGYKGRVIYVDLFMKGRIKLRIIQVYLHTSLSGNRKEIEDVHSYIFKLLDDARQHHFETILMGDFNRSLEEFNYEYRRKGTFHWSYNIFHQLLSAYNFQESISLYHNITQQNPYNTFFSSNSSLTPHILISFGFLRV